MPKTKKIVCVTLGLVSVCILLLCMVLLWSVMFTPAGTYENDGMATDPVSYWKFSGGTITLVTPLSQRNVGIYRKEGNQWLGISSDGQRYHLEWSFTHMTASNMSNATLSFEGKRLFFKSGSFPGL
jgi:hypothetical protein